MTWEQIISNEIKEFKSSPKYALIRQAEDYYRNRSEVQSKKNDIAKRSNTKIEHPIIRKLVNQKADYLLSKPFTISGDSKAYSEALSELFGDELRAKVKSLAKGAVKSGISYMIPYFEDGALRFMRVPSDELIPLWTDTENSKLDGFIRFYDRIEYQGTTKIIMHHAEYWSKDGVQYFQSRDSYYRQVGEGFTPHFTIDGKPYNWAEVPLIWLKYNEEELPLAYFIRELVDSVNWQTSVTEDVLRDVSKFIFVLKNYGGQDLAEFVDELRKSLAVKVDSDGGVDTIQPNVDVSAVLSFIDKQRRDIYDLADGVDTKDPDLGNASGTALYFRYMGLDNDCAALGASLKAAFQRMKSFIDVYFALMGKGDFSGEKLNVVFNTDMPVNESEVITNCRNSEGIISRRTILENHPWTENAEEEQKRLDEEQSESGSMDVFGGLNEQQGVLGKTLGNT
jgi:SPP1 family phage portal protein